MEYYARSPLEVFAIDENKNRLTGSIPYTSLIWTRRYKKPGEFSMQVLSSVYDPSWAYIVCSDRPEMGMVQKVEYSDTSTTPDGEDTITVSGFFLEQLLYDVTFLVEETQEEVIQIEAPRNPNRGVPAGQKPVEVYWSTVKEEYVYRDPSSGQIKDNDGNTVAFGGLQEVDYEWNGKAHHDSIQRPDGSSIDGYWIDRAGYYTSDGGETITAVHYGSVSLPDNDERHTYDVELKVGGRYFYKWSDGRLVMVNGVAEDRDSSYWVKYSRWERGPRTKTVQVKGPWQRTDAGQPEEEGDSVELVIKWVRNFFLNEWQFEEPSFDGETMVLDLSLKYLGDVVYDTLGRIEAAPRVQYDFESDTTVFSVYRGEDMTQEALLGSQGGDAQEVSSLSSRAVSRSVPDGYTWIEYVESTGTQYVDTGMVLGSSSRVVVDYQLTSVPSGGADWYGIFGSRDGAPNYQNAFCTWVAGDGYYRMDYGDGRDGGPQILVPDTGRHVLDRSGASVFMDGALRATCNQAQFTCNYTSWLMAGRSGTGSGSDAGQCFFSNMRLYSCKMYQDGSNVSRDFIPCRRDSDGTVGLYDTVGGQFYGNSGTGSFTAGPEVDLSDSLTYYANAPSYTGATGPTPGVTGQAVTVEDNGFSYSGHVFLGWNTQSDNMGTPYSPGDEYVLTGGSDVLYAQWSQAGDPSDPSGPEDADEAFPYTVFNDTWGSMYGYSASADDSGYKNTIYVLYEYDEPDAFDDDGYPEVQAVTSVDSEGYLITTGWRIPYHTERGYHEVTVGDEGERRRETYLDMRDSDPSCDGDWPRDVTDLEEPVRGTMEFDPAQLGLPQCESIYEGYPQSLKDAGITDLKTNYGRVYNLDTGTLNTDGYIRDYDLGDKVDWGIYKLGIQRTGRIVEAEEVYDQQGIRINLTVGDELVSLMDKARRN